MQSVLTFIIPNRVRGCYRESTVSKILAPLQPLLPEQIPASLLNMHIIQMYITVFGSINIPTIAILYHFILHKRRTLGFW